MKRFLKILLIVVLVLALAALALGLVLFKGWPWWMGATLFAGVLAIVFLVVFLRIYYRRRREREFVRRVISQDDAAIRSAPIHERQQLKDLQAHWKESIDLLRGSHLRKRGNALYVLPWFIVLGESGAGKTSSLHCAGLHSELGEVRRSASLGTTRNCDWWFFDEAIVLDTAGRYTIPLDEGPDKEEWARFLELLSRYRRREPINGIIVVVPADQLLAHDATKLGEDAQEIRRRVDHLTMSLGARSPVYVHVTKLDLVHGMVPFTAGLKDQADQAMGYTNEEANPYWREVLDKAFEAVARRLRILRFALVHRHPDLAAGALLFPTEFQNLKPGLATFLQPLFAENPYQETPDFRGIFFSSARQSGTPLSEFTRTFKVGTPSVPSGGLFLTTFFARILPRDRYLFRRTDEFIRWRTLLRGSGYLAWGLFWACLTGLLGLSFIQNVRVLKSISASYFNPQVLTADPSGALLTLDKLRLEVIGIQGMNRHWWVPRFGLDHSRQMERVLRDRFTSLYRSSILNPLDGRFRQMVNEAGQMEKGEQKAEAIGFLVTRMSILADRLKGSAFQPENLPPVAARFKRPAAEFLPRVHPGLTQDIAQVFADQYYAYVHWNPNALDLAESMKKQRTLLTEFMGRKGVDLHWMVLRWIPGAPDVKLSEFWGESNELSGNDLPTVPGAYTVAGCKGIGDFMDELGRFLLQGDGYGGQRTDFWAWYHDQYFRAWREYLGPFRETPDRFNNPLDRQRLATQMTTRQNPYFMLIKRMAEEFQAQPDLPPPHWAAVASEVSEIMKVSEMEALRKEGGVDPVGKLQAEKARIVEEFQKKIDPRKTEQYAQRLANSRILDEHLNALKGMTPAILSKDTSFRFVAAAFSDKSEAKEGASDASGSAGGGGVPPMAATTSLVRLASSMKEDAGGGDVWDLLAGPFDVLFDYCVGQTAQSLQEQWQQQVAGPAYGVEEDRLQKILFGTPDGLVWKFTEGTAKPFLSRGVNGFSARTALKKYSIPFQEDFLAFLRSGAENGLTPASFSVYLEAVPMEVNPESRVAPYGSQVCLQCADQKPSCFDNFNFEKRITFKWDPAGCGDVTLRIMFPKFTLAKIYRGSSAFPRFLQEFETGTRVFSSREFPEFQAQLDEARIQWVRVNYRIQGGEDILRYFRRAPLRVPSTIIFDPFEQAE